MSTPLATILSVNAAATRLPMGKARAVAWLLAEGLVKLVAGSRVVVWEDVVERIRAADLGGSAAVVVRPQRRGRAQPGLRRTPMR